MPSFTVFRSNTEKKPTPSFVISFSKSAMPSPSTSSTSRFARQRGLQLLSIERAEASAVSLCSFTPIDNCRRPHPALGEKTLAKRLCELRIRAKLIPSHPGDGRTLPRCSGNCDPCSWPSLGSYREYADGRSRDSEDAAWNRDRTRSWEAIAGCGLAPPGVCGGSIVVGSGESRRQGWSVHHSRGACQNNLLQDLHQGETPFLVTLVERSYPATISSRMMRTAAEEAGRAHASAPGRGSGPAAESDKAAEGEPDIRQFTSEPSESSHGGVAT